LSFSFFVRAEVFPFSLYPQIYHANIIKVKGEIVGYLVWKEEHHFLKEPTAYISSFAILPKFQNKRYGSKLLTLNQIKKKGIKTITVPTLKTNNKAIRFYLKYKFKITKLEENILTITCNL